MVEKHFEAKRFESALAIVPTGDKPLVEAYIRVLEPTTAFFRTQMNEGLYGGLTLKEELPEHGESPYTIIRSNGERKAFGYGEIKPYKDYLREIAKRMDDVIGVAFDTRDSEIEIIEATLRPRAQLLKEGKFAEAMMLGLNPRLAPRYHLFVGLLDRYLDPRGLKLVMQGWLQRVDRIQTKYFNDEIAQQITKHSASFRVIYGDMLAAGGMTIERSWLGNTIPSEDGIRNNVGADSFIFPNNMAESTKNVVIPAVRRYTPQVAQIPGWEDSMNRASPIGVVGHETGHALMPFDEKTIELLDGDYMAIKELLAELYGVVEISKLPRSLVTPSLRILIYGRSLARWRSYIDEFSEETDPDKKVISKHYAKAGIWRTNYQERNGGIRVNENGAIEIPDWDKFIDIDGKLYDELLRDISNERSQSGFLANFIRLNSRVPRVYIEDNPDGYTSSNLRQGPAPAPVIA